MFFEGSSICNDIKVVLEKWQHDFTALLIVNSKMNAETCSTTENDIENDMLDQDTIILEIVKDVQKAILGKAAGINLSSILGS